MRFTRLNANARCQLLVCGIVFIAMLIIAHLIG